MLEMAAPCIYDDLKNTDLGERVLKLQERNDKLVEHIKTLEGDIAKLCKELTQMKATESNLKRNISELFNTAKLEVQRKERMIAELQSKLDDMIFKRGKRHAFHGRKPEPDRNINKRGRDDAVEASAGYKRARLESNPASRYDDRHHSRSPARSECSSSRPRYRQEKAERNHYRNRRRDLSRSHSRSRARDRSVERRKIHSRPPSAGSVKNLNGVKREITDGSVRHINNSDNAKYCDNLEIKREIEIKHEFSIKDRLGDQDFKREIQENEHKCKKETVSIVTEMDVAKEAKIKQEIDTSINEILNQDSSSNWVRNTAVSVNNAQIKEEINTSTNETMRVNLSAEIKLETEPTIKVEPLSNPEVCNITNRENISARRRRRCVIKIVN